MKEYLVKLAVPGVGIIEVRIFATAHSFARNAAQRQYPGSRVITSEVIK